MYFNTDINGLRNASAPAYNQLSSIDMAILFTHEFGHNLGYTDRYTPAYPNQSLNVAYNENLYRAWIGTPARTGYWRAGDVPFKGWIFQY